MGITSLAAAPASNIDKMRCPRKAVRPFHPRGALCLRRHVCADLAGDPRAAEPAIAERVFGEKLLMIVLRIVEFPRGRDLGGDLAKPALFERGLISLARSFRGASLVFAGPIDAGTIAGADVIALAHALSRVMRLPEYFEQRVIGDLARIEDDFHRLGMAGQSSAYLLICRVGRHSANAAHRRDPHARQVPERLLRAP